MTDTVHLSWDQVSGLCSTGTGACQGLINGIDLGGWTWATRQDVSALFINGGLPGTNASISASVFDAFVDADGKSGPEAGFFEATYATPTLLYVQGFTRELGPNGQLAYSPYISAAPQANAYAVSHTWLASRSVQSAYAGAWLFRDAAPAEIPEPGTLGLAAAALAYAVVVRRRAGADAERFKRPLH